MSEPNNEQSGLHRKYEVRKDGEPIDDCFVLEPEDDPAARAALKAYAEATENAALAEDLREQFDLELPPQQAWALHNESFGYEPPELPADAWSSDQRQELFDRVIRRHVEWICSKCTGRGPIGSLQKARRHVESNHGHELIEEAATPRDEQDTATDGGTSPSETEQRGAANRGLAEFSGGDHAE